MGVVDCLVLSGGGAKGAYGAGVAKALDAYRGLTKQDSSVCYVGTSAGALNAAVLAAADADALLRFWTTVTPRSVLSARFRSAVVQSALHLLTRRRFFSVYRNPGLKKLIGQSVSLDEMQRRDRHLIVAATNYTRATLKAFYVSPLIDEFIKVDTKLPPEQQRLAHFNKIDSQEELEACLLASAAIPVFFPLVKFGGDWYIDGGIGNHTPTREAAYFLRYLKENGSGIPGVVYCVKQDPPRTILDDHKQQTLSATEVFKRTLEIYHHVHTAPIVRGWSRINKEVSDHQEHVDAFLKWLSSQAIGVQLHDDIKARLLQDLGTLGGEAARQNIPLIEVEPSVDLGDTLDFDPGRIKKTITHGYLDMLDVLKNKGLIDTRDLVNKDLFGA